jgi:hypothetical protein
MSSPDDLSKFVIKTKVSTEPFQSAASALANGEGSGDSAVFNPMESVAAGIRAGNAFAQMFKVCALLLARGIIAPVEVVLRKNFGERYFNGLVTLMVILVLAFFYSLSRMHWLYPVGIGFVYIALVTENQWLCFKRDRVGDYWHSYSEGVSKIRVRAADEYFAKRNFTFDISTLVFEPLAVILAGIVCLMFPGKWIDLIFERYLVNPLALYLIIAGIVLFFYQLYCYLYRRNLLLDEKDNGVIAEIREKLANPSNPVGTFTYKGVTCAVLGGKNEWNTPPAPMA